MFDVECSMFDVRFVAGSYARTQKQVQPLMFAGPIRFFVGMRDRTTMTATIAVDDFVPLVVRYRRRYRLPISTVSQTSAASDTVSQFSMYLNRNPTQS
jgi:hypothetical protein